jgi:hypothetical protein
MADSDGLRGRSDGLGEQNESEAGDAGTVKFIWGTTIELQPAMNQFRDFLINFKPKYRAAYNKKARDEILAEQDTIGSSLGFGMDQTSAASRVPAPNPLYDNLSREKAEEKLYIRYLTIMRKTTQSNLNLDSMNLLAYPPSKKLYHQLIAYPQEVIPIMDQVLKDVMIELCEDAWASLQDGLERDMLMEEANEMQGRIYKVRPFGGEKTVNMRDLNPGGKTTSDFSCDLTRADTNKYSRYRQACFRQGFGHSCHTSHSRHEAWYVASLPGEWAKVLMSFFQPSSDVWFANILYRRKSIEDESTNHRDVLEKSATLPAR